MDAGKAAFGAWSAPQAFAHLWGSIRKVASLRVVSGLRNPAFLLEK